MNKNPEKEVMVKISESLDERLGYNGIVYDPEQMSNPKNNKYGIGLLKRFDRIYQTTPIRLKTGCGNNPPFGKKYGVEFLCWCGTVLSSFRISPPDLARALLKDLQDHPEQFYTSLIIEYVDQHPEKFG